MKKVISKVLLASFLLSVSNSTVFASEKSGTTGHSPDSFFYPLYKFVEKVEVIITFDPVKKAELLSNMANERMDEAQIMADKGKSASSLSAINESQQDQSKVQSIITDEEKKSSTAADNDEEDSQALDALINKIVKDNDENLSQLKIILNNIGKQAKSEVEQAIKIQEANKSTVEAFAEARNNLNNARKQYHLLQVAYNNALKGNDTVLIGQLKEKLNTSKSQYEDALNKLLSVAANKLQTAQNLTNNQENTSQNYINKTESSTAAASAASDSAANNTTSSSTTTTSQPSSPAVDGNNTQTNKVSNSVAAINNAPSNSLPKAAYKNYGQYRSAYVHERNAERKALKAMEKELMKEYEVKDKRHHDQEDDEDENDD